MKVSYRQAASDDVVRQFRYYLVTLNLPDVAVRFRTAVRQTLQSLQQHPWWVRGIAPAIRSFKLFAPGRFWDLRPSGFITCWKKIRSASLESCTASAMFNAFLKMR